MTNGLRKGLSDGTAVGLTAGLLGLMYALAAEEAGLLFWEILFYCAVVYSAAVQFASLNAEVGSVAAVATLISGTAFICSRNILMSLDMAKHSKGRLIEILGMAGLVDAGWALSRGQKPEDFWQYYWGIGLAIYVFWMGGALAGLLIPIPEHPAVDAAFAATPIVFFGLMISLLWRQGMNKLPHLGTMALTIFASIVLGLPDTFAALLGASVAALSFVFLSPVKDGEA